MENKRKLSPHEAASKIIREHAEMIRLLEAFPNDVEQIPSWVKKKKQLLEKIYRRIRRTENE
ncbi:MAG: hypothetical protein N3A69_05670 [Leptospiraceae bacterium]|nr:hypothetical protein [Leptospiraceae bacterium]